MNKKFLNVVIFYHTTIFNFLLSQLKQKENSYIINRKKSWKRANNWPWTWTFLTVFFLCITSCVCTNNKHCHFFIFSFAYKWTAIKVNSSVVIHMVLMWYTILKITQTTLTKETTEREDRERNSFTYELLDCWNGSLSTSFLFVCLYCVCLLHRVSIYAMIISNIFIYSRDENLSRPNKSLSRQPNIRAGKRKHKKWCWHVCIIFNFAEMDVRNVKRKQNH